MIFKDYEFDRNGVIKTPGKFGGEHIYLPLFWQDSLEGLCEENSNGSFSMDIHPLDIEVFLDEAKNERDIERRLGLLEAVAILARKRKVTFFERDDGLVCEVGGQAVSRLKTFEEREA